MNILSWIQPNFIEGVAILVVVLAIPIAIIVSALAIIKFIIIKIKTKKL